MGVELLPADVQAIPDVVDVVDVDDPHPGALPLHGGAGLAVPLGQLPVPVGVLHRQSFHGGGEVPVGYLGHVPLGVVVVVLQGALAVVEAVALIGVGGAPAHHHRVGEHPLGQIVPAGALHDDVDADGPHLLRGGHGHRLAHAVAAGVEADELRLQPVPLHDAVPVGVGPAGVGQELLGVVHVGLDGHLRIVPGHAVVLGVAGGGVAVHRRLRHLLAVDGVGDGLADLQVAGHVVADGIPALRHLPRVGQHRQGEAPVVHGGDVLDPVPLHLGGGQGGGGEGHVHLPRPGGGQGRVLVHEDDGHPLHGRDLAVVVLIGLQDQLLLGVPLDELEGAGADGVGPVVRAVGVLRDDAHGGDGVQEGGGGPGEGEDHGGVVRGLHRLQKGQVHGGLGGLGGLKGEDHVGGGHRLAVGEEGVVPEGEGPGQAVFGQVVAGGQVVGEGHVVVVLHQGALDDGGVAMAPALAGVQGLRLRGDGDDDAVPVLAAGLAGLGPVPAVIHRGGAAGGEQPQQRRQRQEERKKLLYHSTDPFSFDARCSQARPAHARRADIIIAAEAGSRKPPGGLFF